MLEAYIHFSTNFLWNLTKFDIIALSETFLADSINI